MAASNGSVIWIASYPKSGNTWVRFLICNLVFGPQETAARLNELAPDIHELGPYIELPAGPLFVKTHFRFGRELPLVERSVGLIYIVRHPADVMLSNFHYARRSNGIPPDTTLDRYFEHYLSARGDPRWVRLGAGGWDEHVRSWLAVRHSFPVLLLRYEDLLTDPARGVLQLCTFLGLQRSEQELERAAAGASFESLRSIEEADIRSQRSGIFYKPYLRQPLEAGLRFMRAGRAFEAHSTLGSARLRRLHDVFGPVMHELGYLEAPWRSGGPQVT